MTDRLKLLRKCSPVLYICRCSAPKAIRRPAVGGIENGLERQRRFILYLWGWRLARAVHGFRLGVAATSCPMMGIGMGIQQVLSFALADSGPKLWTLAEGGRRRNG